MAKKQDLAAQLVTLQRKLNQDSADTVARMAQLRAVFVEKFEELEELLTAQAKRHDEALTLLIDLVVDQHSELKQEIEGIKARLARLEDPSAA
ncbi:MAG: hypothetical protein HY319_02960 [Armatimonadetes bacterium]|nr:hypothetical protein [Armatimonadota bacterium]